MNAIYSNKLLIISEYLMRGDVDYVSCWEYSVAPRLRVFNFANGNYY